MTSLGEDAVNGHGFVKIKPTMQLLNHPSIFAVGDIIDWTEQKQIAKLMWHVPVIVANVVSFLNGVAPTKKYAGAPEIIVITNGKVSQKPGELLWLDPDMIRYRKAAWATSGSWEDLPWVIGLPGWSSRDILWCQNSGRSSVTDCVRKYSLDLG